MDENKDRFPLLRKILKAIGLPAEAVDDIVERILDWLSTKDEPAEGPAVLPFKLRDDFLSPAELSFYQVLTTVVGSRATVCTKVNLADLFFVATGDQRKNRANANRIDRKHVDFLLCDPKSMRPRAGIELDDRSHERASRKTRDELVGEVFANAGLPLIRVPVKTGYARGDLEQVLAPYLPAAAQPDLAYAPPPSFSLKPPATATPAGVPATPPAPVRAPVPSALPAAQPAPATATPTASAEPVCPKCGSKMVLRTAKSGGNTGGQFWGCSAFPRCRSVLPATPK